MPDCTARKGTGVICNKALPEGRTLCTRHETVKQNKGPNAFAVDQLKLKQKIEKKAEDTRLAPIFQQIIIMPHNDPVRRELLEQYSRESGEFHRRQSNERAALLRQQRIEIAQNGGINPDQEQNSRRLVDNIIKQWQPLRRQVMRWPDNNWNAYVEQYRTRVQLVMNGGEAGEAGIERLRQHLDFIQLDYQQLVQDNNARAPGRRADAVEAARIRGLNVPPVARAVDVPAVVNPNENMAAFARDKQNVHTSAAVTQVKHNISIIRQVFVPPEYRWNPTTISKTYREIVFDCDLSPKGNWQFASYYCNNATIYDMEPGIFGIMTDGVWQYIRDSEDKRCLINILKREFEDNVGMCAQGNLSRVCNILSGYLPGIGQAESTATILGREFPKLMEIEDESGRLVQAQRILRENNVPEAEWESWLEPLRA